MEQALRKFKSTGRPVYVAWRGTPAAHDVCSVPNCTCDAVTAVALIFGGIAILYACARHANALDAVDERMRKPRSRIREDHIGFQLLPKRGS